MPPDPFTQNPARWYALVLLLLTAFFAFRVIAQLVQLWHPIEFLPAFGLWHSGAMPYGWLLGLQVLILIMCLRIVWQLFANRVIPSPRKGQRLFVLGCIYFGGMCGRLLVGLTIAPNHVWFGAMLPTVFHLVLAAFVIFYGRFHSLASQALVEVQKGASA